MNSTAQTYECVIWDWNGTLFNDVQLCVDSINRLLAERGLPEQTLNSYRNLFDFPVIEYYRRVGFDFESERFEFLGAEFIRHYEDRRNECSLYEGAVRLIEHCGTRYTQAVLSAYRQEDLEQVLEVYGIRGHFCEVHGHHDIYASGKVDNGRRLVEKLGMDPGRILLIGDTVHDHEVAEAIGVNCLLLSHGHHDHERLSGLGVPVVDSFSELEAYLNLL